MTAHQAGSGRYAAAADVPQTFNIAAKYTQAISFGSLATQVMGAAPITVSASASSGLTVNFTAAGTCSSSGTNGSTITLSSVGTCTVTAHQAGDNQYFAAADVPQTFSIILLGGWTQVAPLVPATAGGNAAGAPCFNNLSASCIYLAGGGTTPNENAVEMYNPAADSWVQAASMNVIRNSFAATSGPCEGNLGATCIYALAGANDSLPLSTPLRCTHRPPTCGRRSPYCRGPHLASERPRRPVRGT